MRKSSIIFIIIVILVFCLVYSLSSQEYTSLKSSIIFSHEFHVMEQEIECLSCHVSIETSQLSSDKNLPTMDECSNCHDVDDENSCGMCHKNTDEFMETENPIRELTFNHQSHLQLEIDCNLCHSNVVKSNMPNTKNLPDMKLCFNCHDNSTASKNCNICHTSGLLLSEIHPIDWLYRHESKASTNSEWCNQCHDLQSDCTSCHSGDNLTGSIHDLNYFFTHGMDAGSKNITCQKCHDNQNFCVTCHEQNLRMPLNHSKIDWLMQHGIQAKHDVENCASCHDTGDPTCSRIGCHNDFDGVKGTDPPIHDVGQAQLKEKGYWHEDDNYYCFQCHVSTRNLNIGFCTYCHTELED